MKKQLKIFVPIALGVFFIYLTFQITSEAERALIWGYIKSAQTEYVLAAMGLGASADIIRGLHDQMIWDGRISKTGAGCVCAFEEGDAKEWIFWDEITGEPLDFEGVGKKVIFNNPQSSRGGRDNDGRP